MEEKEFFDYNPEVFVEALTKRDVKTLRQIFDDCNLIDIAETLNSLEDISEYVFIFKTIDSEYTAEVFSYLDSDKQEDIVTKLTGDQLQDILDNLYTDDIVDFIQELPANLASRILKSCSKELRTKVNQLLSYKEDTAGSIMTTEYIILKETDTEEVALKKVRAAAQEAETLSYLFVCDESRTLKGTIMLKDVLAMKDDQTIADVMDIDFISVYTNTDQEEVANTFKKYDINAVAVTTAQFKLVGIITVDDILDVIEDETTEDMQLMANLNPLEDEYTKTSAFELAKKGVGWLILLMLLSTFTSLIMNKFEDAMAAVSSLAIFIPMLIDTAGNAGNQSSSVIIRALGIGEISTKDYFKIVLKELLSALMVGIVVGVINFGWILLLSKIGLIDLSSSSINAVELGLLVGISMIICIILSKFVGSSLPILCKALRIDPALLAGPMVTTVVDASSLLIYFFMATKVFNYLAGV